IRAPCKPGECRDGLAVGIDYRIERQGNGSEAPLLHLLLPVVDVAVAVGVEPREDEAVHRDFYLGSSEHVGFHPATVGARVSGKIDEYTPVLLARYGERGGKIVEAPVELGWDIRGVYRSRCAAYGRKERFKRTKRATRQAGGQPHAKREKHKRRNGLRGTDVRQGTLRCPGRFRTRERR